jgi:hypothetical protein
MTCCVDTSTKPVGPPTCELKSPKLWANIITSSLQAGYFKYFVAVKESWLTQIVTKTVSLRRLKG